MSLQRFVEFAGTGMGRAGVFVVSLALVFAFVVSPQGMGMNPLAGRSGIYAVVEKDIARPIGGTADQPDAALHAGTLVETIAAGSWGALVRQIRLDDAKPAPGLIRLPPSATDTLCLVSIFGVAANAVTKDRPGPLSSSGPKLGEGSTAVARMASNGWVEIFSGGRWCWVLRSSLRNLSGTAAGERSMYRDPGLEDKQGSLPPGTVFQVLGEYKESYLVSCKEAAGLFWVWGQGIEVK